MEDVEAPDGPRQDERQGSGHLGASAAASATATEEEEEEEEAAASASASASASPNGSSSISRPPGGRKTWSCEQCSLENEEPDAEALLSSGGIVSCALCLRVRGQYAWHCPDCAYMNALKAHACKMCGHVAFARGKKDGSRSEAAAIARDYKKRRRKVAAAASGVASSKGSVLSPTASLVTKAELEESEEDEASASASAFEPAATTPLPSPSPTPSVPPFPGPAAASAVEAVRDGQSGLFAQQLRAMHSLVRELGRWHEFRSAFS